MSLVLSTATQPALGPLHDPFGRLVQRGLENVREIIPDPVALFERLRRVRYTWPQDNTTQLSWPEVAIKLQQEPSVLAIVNSRRDCRDLYRLMPADSFHLSALQCPQHRSELIARIKQRLKDGLPTRVVSTQLVEAGVDVDFPVVYRAFAGLDSLAQAAGRCNREGRLDEGRVEIFYPPGLPPPGLLRQAAQVAGEILYNHHTDDLPPQLFREYFQRFYGKVDKKKADEILAFLQPGSHGEVAFRSAAECFRVIDDADQQCVFIAYDNKATEALGLLRSIGPARWLIRRLQRYSVNLPKWQFDPLLRSGDLEELHPGYFTPRCAELYDRHLGLQVTEQDAPTYAADRLIV